MDYKKKYEEALARAREWSETKNGYYMPKELCEEIFPELQESEDEKIRKELIQFIKNWKDPKNIGRPHDFPTLTRNIEQCDRYIAWLEKQGIQKPTWSYEDERIYQNALDAFEALGNDLDPLEDWGRLYDWLKSLKDHIQPQNQWKPTEEQIHWLKWVINRLPDTEKANEAEAILEDLLEQLNEL